MLGLPIKGSGEGNSDTWPRNESDWLNAHACASRHTHTHKHANIVRN